MAVIFDYTNHKKLWLLMRDNIEAYITAKYVPTFYDAEVAVDDLKAALFANGDMEIDYEDDSELPLFYCYACQYAWDTLCTMAVEPDKKDRCPYCPLTGWEADKCFVQTQLGTKQEGLFHQLCVAVQDKQIETAKELCERIANLEVREDVLTDEPSVAETLTQVLKPGDIFVIERPDAFYKLPLCVYVLDNTEGSRTQGRYINSEGILEVCYQENSVTIINNWQEDIEFIVIDPDKKKYNTPIFRDIIPGGQFTIDRINNFTVLPVTVMVKHSGLPREGNKESEPDVYIDHTPFLTVSYEDNTYTIFNDNEETMSYVIMSAAVPAEIVDKHIGANSITTVARSNLLKQRTPIVLVKDLTPNSITEGQYISGTGLITISLSENVIILYNDTSNSLECRVIFVANRT